MVPQRRLPPTRQLLRMLDAYVLQHRAVGGQPRGWGLRGFGVEGSGLKGLGCRKLRCRMQGIGEG